MSLVYNGLSIGAEYPGGCNCKLAVEGKIAAREIQVLGTGWLISFLKKIIIFQH